LSWAYHFDGAPNKIVGPKRGNTPAMNKKIWIALVVCFALHYSACVGSKETSFFSNFSLRQLVEHSKSSAGLACDSNGGGGGGIKAGTGGIGFGGTRFNSHKSDSFACRLDSKPPEDFEMRLFAGLKLDVQQALRDNGAQITESGDPKPASFYFAYTVKNVRGRVQVSGTRVGADYYDVHADLEESGN
jgi:hypothetical protein